MDINSINNLGNGVRKPSGVKAGTSSSKVGNTSAENTQKDSASISQGALEAQELSKIFQEVQKSSDVRSERVNEIREKIKNNEYDSLEDEILDKIAEKIALALIR